MKAVPFFYDPQEYFAVVSRNDMDQEECFYEILATIFDQILTSTFTSIKDAKQLVKELFHPEIVEFLLKTVKLPERVSLEPPRYDDHFPMKAPEIPITKHLSGQSRPPPRHVPEPSPSRKPRPLPSPSPSPAPTLRPTPTMPLSPSPSPSRSSSHFPDPDPDPDLDPFPSPPSSPSLSPSLPMPHPDSPPNSQKIESSVEERIDSPLHPLLPVRGPSRTTARSRYRRQNFSGPGQFVSRLLSDWSALSLDDRFDLMRCFPFPILPSLTTGNTCPMAVKLRHC